MPNRNAQQRRPSTPTDSTMLSGKRGWLRLGAVFLLFAFAFCLPAAAQTITLQQAAGGVTFVGLISPFHSGFGTVNGLGIGNPAAGLTKLAVAGGEFYYTPYTINLAGANNGHPAIVHAYISTNFSNPTSVIQLMSCPNPGPCNTFGSYAALPTTQAGEITVLPTKTVSTTYTAYLGLFVGDTNGVAVTANDSATISFDVFDQQHNSTTTVQLKLDLPSVSVQTAVQLQLATAPLGLTINAGGATDYTASFGTVNGLGIGPGAGLTVVPGQAPNGIIYSTPYLLKPAFSGFSSANATKITVYVSTDFVHSTVLKLYDSQSQLSGYNAISKVSGAGATTITNAAANGTSITEYLGLFVSNLNGPTSYRGADSATLTYTITVQ
jgi:hypothetical protein